MTRLTSELVMPGVHRIAYRRGFIDAITADARGVLPFAEDVLEQLPVLRDLGALGSPPYSPPRARREP